MNKIQRIYEIILNFMKYATLFINIAYILSVNQELGRAGYNAGAHSV